MTYAMAWSLQEAIYSLLTTAPGTVELIGSRVYDAVPQDEALLPRDAIYVTLGDEMVDEWRTGSDNGAIHQVTMIVHAPKPGFLAAKQVAAAICDTMLEGNLSPSRGRVVQVSFIDGKTKRSENALLRQIILRFRISLEDTA